MKRITILSVAAALCLPGLALADISTFTWSYGGGTDPVYAHGTLTATLDPSSTPGLYDIIGGSGFRTDSSGTYALTILPLGTNPLGCTYSLSNACSIRVVGGTDLIYDNLLYLGSSTPGYELDADGIVVYTPTDPNNQYFSMWSQGSGLPQPPDQEFNPTPYAGTNLANPFTVTLVPTPEPSFYAVLAVGLAGLGLFAAKRNDNSKTNN
jgi:hypothetical protein